MTRERLEQLSKYELAEIILRQQEMLELQQTRIEQLEAHVAELEAQIESLIGPPKDYTNFSLPPSKSSKPNRDSLRRGKRGPKQGHRGRSHKLCEPSTTGLWWHESLYRCWNDRRRRPRDASCAAESVALRACTGRSGDVSVPLWRGGA